MKSFVQFVLLMLLSCNDPCCSERTFIPGCDQTNEGNEFFVGFFRNRFGRSDEQERIPPVLWITTKESMPVNFTVSTFFGFLASGVATPGEITYVDIPLGFVVFDSTEDSETDTRFKGIYIKAEDDRRIIMFGQNEEVPSDDAYLALPIILLPTGRSYEYIAASIRGDSGTVAQAKDSVALIIGTENDTEIILEPSVLIRHPFATQSGGQFIPRVPVEFRTVTIQRFQTFYLEVRGGDISGTRIIANKPISVFSGHECANIPLPSEPCDIVIEQLQPIDTWGTEVVTVPLRTRSGDVLKVFASQDSTTVNVTYTDISSGMVTSDSFSFTLNRNEFRELGGTSLVVTGAIADFALIQSNNPIAVFQFSRSFSTDNNIISDPFMLSVPSCEQYRNSYAVAPAPFDPSIEGTVSGRVAYVNYTNIAVPAEYFNASLITVNNNPINASEFRPIRRADNSIWGYGAQLLLDEGAQVIRHSDPNAALSVTLYGFSNQMSWGCTGGTGLALVALSMVSFETNAGSGITIVISESAGPLVVVLVLSEEVGEPVTVYVIAIDITARAGKDFGPSQNYTVTFPAGSTRQSVNIPIINDTVFELDETFQLELSVPEAAVRAGVIDGCDPRQTFEIIDDDLNCGHPGAIANGNVTLTSTNLGSTVTYTCHVPFVLCGDDTRTCLTTGMWSGSIPSCNLIRSVVTVKRTTYTVKESDGFVDVTILVDTPNCHAISVTLHPKEQTPVDATVADFDSTPIGVTILPGDTDVTVSIPIVNDTIVEGEESFDVLLEASGIGVVVGDPRQAEVTIAGTCILMIAADGASSDSSSDDHNGIIIALAIILAIAVSGLVISVVINVFFIVQRKQSRYNVNQSSIGCSDVKQSVSRDNTITDTMNKRNKPSAEYELVQVENINLGCTVKMDTNPAYLIL